MPRLRFPHVGALDGVRGLAALAIVAHHCLYGDFPPIPWPHRVMVVNAASEFLVYGVDLFFVLSGYLITSLLLLARRAPNYYFNFYWKRVFRILPALVLVLLLSHFFGFTPWIDVGLSLIFISNFNAMMGLQENGPFWSLSIEEQFYLLWPMLLHRTRPRVMVRILVAVIVVNDVLRFISHATHHGRMHYTFVHCDGLAWGALLAILAFKLRVPWSALNARRLWRSFGRWAMLVGLIGCTASILISVYGQPEFGLLLSSAPVLFAGLLAFLITHPRSPLTRTLRTRPLRYLGDISYMVYLSHPYILALYDKHIAHWPPAQADERGFYLRFVYVLAATLVWSTLTLYAFERPIGKLRRYILKPE